MQNHNSQSRINHTTPTPKPISTIEHQSLHRPTTKYRRNHSIFQRLLRTVTQTAISMRRAITNLRGGCFPQEVSNTMKIQNPPQARAAAAIRTAYPKWTGCNTSIESDLCSQTVTFSLHRVYIVGLGHSIGPRPSSSSDATIFIW